MVGERRMGRSAWQLGVYASALLLVILTGCGGGGGNAPRTKGIGATPAELVDRDGFYAPQTAPGILVKFKPSTTGLSIQSSFATLDVHQAGSFELVPNLVLVEYVPTANVSDLLATLRADPTVEYAEPNYLFSTFQVIPNDPRFGNQDGLHNLGQNAGKVDADIDGPEAWTLEQGKDVVIAVIDSGVDYNHPDLRNNIWTNPGEIANNGIDDDGNGFIDDVHGWDFANNDNDPMDDNRHGTHVAGIIAAESNNGIGIAGINWKAKIMAAKFIDAAGSGSTANAIKAIQYATKMGARISNNSWGGGAASQALQDAITAANAAGQLFVAAAGNNGTDNDTTPSYPANYNLPNILSVAATNNSDALASFSNFGVRTVHVAAPGSGIISTIPNNSYASLSGTSMAAPFVTGIAGLVLSRNPTFNVNQVRSAIINSVDKIPALATRVSTGGRVNAFQALGGVPAALNIKIDPNRSTIAAGGSITFSASGGAAPYSWQVTNTAIATIDAATGRLTALSAGTTEVVVTDSNQLQARQGLTVTTLRITPASAALTVSQSLQLVASGGAAQVQWSSSNPAVATVAQTGVLTGVSAGTTTVTATDADGVSIISGTFTVANSTAVNVAVSTPVQVIGVGGTLAATVSGGAAPYQWSTSDTTVATVDTSGLVTGRAPGKFTVMATDANGVVGSSAMLTVEQLQVFVAANALAIGATAQLQSSGGTAPIVWSVSSTNVASVSVSGLLTGLNPGSVTATATDANGVSATSEPITVFAPSLVTVAPATTTVQGDTWRRFTATGGNPPYTWSLGAAGIGNIDPVSGWFKAAELKTTVQGTVVVTDANGNTAQAVVTVTPDVDD